MVLGAVLAGGASRRMGADKATLPLDGRPMAAWVIDALRSAGATDVVLVGADAATGRSIGVATIADASPGTGPLGGLATALRWATTQDPPDPLLLVAACDQPSLTSTVLAALVEAMRRTPTEIGACRFRTPDGRVQPLPSCWRADATVGPVTSLHATGERRIGAAFATVATADQPSDGIELVDLDTPADVERWQAQQPPR